MGYILGGYLTPAGGGGGISTVTSGAITSGSVTPGTLSSGAVGSGIVASGTVQGFFGTTRHVTSGSLGVFDFGSGAVTAGTVGSGAIVSGNLASGQVGNFHLVTGGLTSGALASGTVEGFFGATRHIASGTVGSFDLASGAVTAGTVGSGAVVSGNVASGQLAYFHFASGASIDAANWLIEDTFTCAEAISGGRAVAFTQSGTLQIAMAGISGRMPAVGVAVTNYTSGNTVTLFTRGRVFNTILNFSGWMNQPVYVGASGDLVASGAPILSGNIQQIIGVSTNQSGLFVQVGDPLEGVLIQSGDIGSGAVFGQAASGQLTIASGSIITYDTGSGLTAARSQLVAPLFSGTSWSLITEEAISGVRAVCVSQSGRLRQAMASVSGRMPAIGVVIDNVASGITANVYSHGVVQATSGLVDHSGWLGYALWVGRSGQIVQWSGAFNSGGFNVASGGDFLQRAGVAINSGGFLIDLAHTMSQTQLIGTTNMLDTVNREFGV